MKLIFVTGLIALSTAACSHRQKILDANWVSMKYSDVPKESNLQRVATVETKYCMTSWSGVYGLMDEVVKQAESKFQVDYIKNPAFTLENGNCMTLSGEGYRRN